MPQSRADRGRAGRGAGPAGDKQGLGAGRLAGADSTPRGRDLLPAVSVKSQELADWVVSKLKKQLCLNVVKSRTYVAGRKNNFSISPLTYYLI